jgi:hypothetical protein
MNRVAFALLGLLAVSPAFASPMMGDGSGHDPNPDYTAEQEIAAWETMDAYSRDHVEPVGLSPEKRGDRLVADVLAHACQTRKVEYRTIEITARAYGLPVPCK